MISQIIISPFDTNLIKRMRGLCLVVRTNNYEDVKLIDEAVNPDNMLHCIRVDENRKLSEIEFNNDWCKIPVALYLQSMGIFRDCVNNINVLRKSNVRIFLPSGNKENYTSLTILASQGIECGIYFEEKIFIFGSAIIDYHLKR